MIPLGLLTAGERGDVLMINIAHEDKRLKHIATQSSRIENIGLRVGKSIEILQNEGNSPILLKTGETRLAIDRLLAMKIMIGKQYES